MVNGRCGNDGGKKCFFYIRKSRIGIFSVALGNVVFTFEKGYIFVAHIAFKAKCNLNNGSTFFKIFYADEYFGFAF
ncbi:MAG: YSIRK-type signal peptide-containing protein [Clostridia bacterium]|nr:YSIRK-type signal peptide-containing protein [Clostridia bacterium]